MKSRWMKFLIYGFFLAILGVLFLTFVFYSTGRPREESVSVNSDSPPNLKLGNFYPIEGTDYYLAEIFNDRPSSYLDYSSARWYSFGNGGQTRNLVFLDGESLESRKMYGTNESFILSVIPFPQKSTNQGESSNQEIVAVKWFAYYVVHQDVNEDGLLNEKDPSVLAISDYNGLRYKEVIKDILNLYELTMAEDGRLLVVYRLLDSRYASLIDTQTQEVILTQPLPELGTEVE